MTSTGFVMEGNNGHVAATLQHALQSLSSILHISRFSLNSFFFSCENKSPEPHKQKIKKFFFSETQGLKEKSQYGRKGRGKTHQSVGTKLA